MRYYNYDMAKRMVGTAFDSALQHYFPNNDEWGVCVYFTREKDVDFMEICKLSNVSVNGATWTHYANIQRADSGRWEVNTQFNGEKEDEMWIFAYYKHFRVACHCIASNGFKTRKPKYIYK